MLMSLALMLAAAMALSGVAQAKKPASAPVHSKCAKLAQATLGPSFDPSGYTFTSGTRGDDVFLNTLGGLDVFCGFDGNDYIQTLDEGDVFLGGAGDDSVYFNSGTFYGGAGTDAIEINYAPGTFYGGTEADTVSYNQGTFYGEEGDDIVSANYGTFVQ